MDTLYLSKRKFQPSAVLDPTEYIVSRTSEGTLLNNQEYKKYSFIQICEVGFLMTEKAGLDLTMDYSNTDPSPLWSPLEINGILHGSALVDPNAGSGPEWVNFFKTGTILSFMFLQQFAHREWY